MFTITKTNKNDQNFHDMEFVCTAMETKKSKNCSSFSKPYASHICINIENKVIATDAAKLHICNNHYEIPQGYYEVIKQTKDVIILNQIEIDYKYPDYKQITPEKSEFIGISNYSSISKMSKTMFLLAQKNIFINYDYLLNLKDEFKINITGTFKPVIFENHTKTAYIMPMKP